MVGRNSPFEGKVTRRQILLPPILKACLTYCAKRDYCSESVIITRAIAEWTKREIPEIDFKEIQSGMEKKGMLMVKKLIGHRNLRLPPFQEACINYYVKEHFSSKNSLIIWAINEWAKREIPEEELKRIQKEVETHFTKNSEE